MLTLRDYQTKGVNDIREQYRIGHRRVVFVMPTGGGKTVVFSHIAHNTASNFKKVLILAHRIELLEQCGNKLAMNDVDFGYINPKYTASPHSLVQVGSMQTVVRRMEKLNFYPDLIIIDECHRVMGKTYRDIIQHYSNARVLGVTATPVRGDGKPLGDVFQSMVLGPDIEQLIGWGSLVRPITFAPIEQLDLSDVKTVNGEWERAGLVKKVDNSSITGSAVDHYRKFCPGVPSVAFCVSIDHAKHVAADFSAAGYNFLHIDGEMGDSERRSILEALTEGRIHGITSVDLVTEGYDAPMLQCAIMLRPTQSEGLYLQMAGRVLRPFPGKDCAYILDHAGCSLRHGLVTQKREWSLDGEIKVRRKKNDVDGIDIKVKQCPTCFLVHEPAPVCPNCKHIYVIVGRTPDVKDGELQMVGPEQAMYLARQKEYEKQLRKDEVRNATTLDQLIALGQKYGYKKPAFWARKVFAGRNLKEKLV